MKPFLEKLSEEIIQEYCENLSQVCIVFPSRRAGIFFKKYLSQKITKPVWSPSVMGIQDFIAGHSPFMISDKLILIFELFEVYKAYGDGESFDKFYPWGEMLLNDFEDIDKNLVDSSKLFKILREFKDVEEQFEFSFDDIGDFEKFWRTFSNQKLTNLQDQFIKTWQIVSCVYTDFRKRLAEKKLAYEGMAYRRIYEDVKSKKIDFVWEKIIFAGFNNLNKAEEGIISELIKTDKARVYWDCDEYYVNDKKQEAGFFLNKNFENFNAVTGKNSEKGQKWIENNLSQSQKNIKIIGAPLPAGEAKTFGKVLQDLINNKIPSDENTAVILPDENLLIPVLYSIPETVDKLNVTMGYSFKNSPLYNLVKLLKDFQENKKITSAVAGFYHKNVLGILMHPYVKFSGTGIHKLVNEIKKYNIIYVSESKIKEGASDLIKQIFKPVKSVPEILEYLYSIINIISDPLHSSKNSSAKFEMEYFYHFLVHLNRLKDIISEHSSEISSEMFWNLLLEVLNTVKIPFIGEPLEGIQVMGLLETRALDFNNIFILSMNEGIMPRGNVQSSFIPFGLRKSFKLPVYEDEDRAYAYYFYRLLQKAKNIYLIYNTESEKIYSGEKSRFIIQIENELAKINPNVILENYILQTDIIIQKHKEISVPKNEDTIEKLKKREYFSASGLSTYINCPLQFYYRYIAGLKEEDTIDDFFSGGEFGRIFHRIAEILYKEYAGMFITTEIIESLKKKLEKNYDKIWEKAFESLKELEGYKTHMQGKNLLLKRVIKRLLAKVLENDIIETPFKIIEVEKTFRIKFPVNINSSIHETELYGQLDRIEEKNGLTRILDYKTGMFEPKNRQKKTEEEYFNNLFNDPKFRENFQQYFYGYLFSKSNPGSPVSIGIYPLRKMSSGVNYFESKSIAAETFAVFEKYLHNLLNDIFNPEIPFKQTNDIARCKWCAYKSICYRE